MDLQSNKINLNNIDLQNNKNKLVIYIYIYQNTKYFNTHTQRKRGKVFKKTNSGIYPKETDCYISLKILYNYFMPIKISFK